MDRVSFLIVGGGASGTLLATQLLRRATKPLQVVIAEPAALARGVAYATPHPEHLLNVPAARMSALPDEPEHFTRWLVATGQPAPPGGFVARRVYGDYLEATLLHAARMAVPGVRLRWLVDRVDALVPDGQGQRARLASGEAIAADRVALAIGNLPGPAPVAVDSDRFIGDPWRAGALDGISPDDPVAIVGTGLTMVDVVLLLASRGHSAPIHAFSRRGLLPREGGSVLPSLLPFAPTHRVPGLRAWLRWARARQRADSRGDWRATVDALRPVTPAIWQGLSGADRRRFLRHLRPHWDVVRHRMAPCVAAILSDLIRGGRVRVEAARVAGARAASDGLEITLVPRAGQPRVQRTSWLVNATGPEMDVARARGRSRLLAQLLADGVARPDQLRLGLDATPAGSVIDAAGQPSRTLDTLGPPLRGVRWETTAIPEIRVQAQALARRWICTTEAERAPQDARFAEQAAWSEQALTRL